MNRATTWFGEALEQLGDAPVIRAMPPLLLALALFRIPAGMPEYHLDGSWELALNAALVAGIPFGDRITFTYGPASSIVTGAFHPETFWVNVALGVVLALAASWLLHRQVRGRSPWLALLFATLMLGADREATLVVLPASLMMGFVGLPRDDHLRRDLGLGPRELVVASGAIGLLFAIKGTFLPLGVLSVIALAVFGREWRRDARTPLLVIASALAAFAGTWISYGQALRDVPQFISGVVAVSAGFSEAMEAGWTGTTLGAVSAYLLGIALSGAMFARNSGTRSERWLAGAVVIVTVFTLLKLGFVRADHIPHAMAGLALLAPLVGGSAPTRWRLVIGAVSVVALAVIGSKVSWSVVREGLPIHQIRMLGDHARGWEALTDPDDELVSEFQVRLRAVAWQHPLPALSGTVDIYSRDQMRAIASGLDWDPRPVFQSYSAYTLGDSATSGLLDERIDVDVAGAIVYVQIDADPSWLGSLALLGFRSAPLYLWVELSSGGTRIYRLPMGLAEAGFILSPFVGDLPQVATLLASPPGGSIEGLPRVTAFRVITERPELWQPRFDIRWQTFDRG